MELTNLQAYVANRVNVIRQHTVSWQWLYISTDNNPADLVSRGVRPHELSSCEQWWHGPRFLNDSEYNFPITETNTSSDLPEVKHCLVLSSDHGSRTGPLEYVLERLVSNCSDLRKMDTINKELKYLMVIKADDCIVYKSAGACWPAGVGGGAGVANVKAV
ncbi:unnamed protein product [Plutella xylostella]|uniref:(diamondback moth) hypothetical protein n=1 Tax=Plutella xylostella TaxID=51655 RepID=A0A8S4DMX3_PLUXY|nr:unnamed protein product [Plutella xylostella]